MASISADRRQPRWCWHHPPAFTDAWRTPAPTEIPAGNISAPRRSHLIRGRCGVLSVPSLVSTGNADDSRYTGDSTQLRGDLVVRFQLNLGMDLTRRNIGGGGDVRVAVATSFCVQVVNRDAIEIAAAGGWNFRPASTCSAVVGFNGLPSAPGSIAG